MRQVQLPIDRLRRLGVKTLVLGPGPYFKGDLHKVILREGSLEELPERLKAASNLTPFDADAQLRDYALKAGAAYVSKREFFCPENYCKAFLDFSGHLMVFDSHHLTLDAAREFGIALKIDAPERW